MLLLDEIEKAHPDVFNMLLQVMDHGTLTDNNGKQSDFRHVILLMTSNVGARELSRRHAAASASGDRSATPTRRSSASFSPEFRNRLDARIRLRAALAARHGADRRQVRARAGGTARRARCGVELSAAARAYLAEKGYDPLNGARPLARLIQEEIKRPLTDELLFGRLAEGGRARVEAGGEGVQVEVG